MSSPKRRTKVVKNLTFTQPFREKSTNIVQQPQIVAIQPAYSLSHQEFKDLITPENTLSTIISRILALAVGYALLIFGKYIASLINKQPSGIENWEKITFVIAVVLVLTLYFISNNFLPNKKKKVIKSIEKYYEENPVLFEPYASRKK